MVQHVRMTQNKNWAFFIVSENIKERILLMLLYDFCFAIHRKEMYHCDISVGILLVNALSMCSHNTFSGETESFSFTLITGISSPQNCYF